MDNLDNNINNIPEENEENIAEEAVEEIVEAISEARTLVRASFVVDNLTYLARGGRCTAVTALLANTLQLKPRIEVKMGKMGVEIYCIAAHNRIFITYSNCIF